MRFEGTQLATEFEKAFGTPITEATPQQLWFLTKLAKHVRLRARNNAAFNNYMNSNFRGARFRQVTKTREDGTTYPGLEISANGVAISDEE